ncbi:MAG: Xaa-Pro peptidase family protein [Coriobacteriia bacterium]|nr:Xaa-Pro peptidase family protein [Coriobacteriia bacterium]
MSLETRIARVRKLAAEKGYDAVVIRNNPDLRWLTGAERVFDFESAHTAFITQDELFVHTDSRYYNTFIERLGKDSIWRFDEDNVRHNEWIVQKAIETHSRVVALEDSLSVSLYQSILRASQDASAVINFVFLHNDLVEMRAIKDAEEIELMRHAQAITDAAFSHMLEFVQVGMTEKQIQAELEGYMYSEGADGLAFESIVASGPNTANAHAKPSDRKLEKGDFLLLDYGASYRDYNSDMTRTMVMGEAAEWQKEIYEIVLNTNQEITRLSKPGVIGSEMHQKAVDMITKAGYGDYFKHGLGHGVGIEIHEEPVYGLRDKHTFVPGHVVTIEPGIYLPQKGGVRIEDYGVITEEGIDIFTQSTHELQIL